MFQDTFENNKKKKVSFVSVKGKRKKNKFFKQKQIKEIETISDNP